MTLSVLANVWSFPGNGATTVFDTTEKVFLATDLEVTLTNAAGVDTVLVLNTDYLVTNLGLNSGARVTTQGALSPPQGAETLTIRRNVPLTQSTDLKAQSAYSPEVVEDALDRQTMMALQLDEILARALVRQLTDLTVVDAVNANIINLLDPTEAQMAATKAYVDSVALGATLPQILDTHVDAAANIQMTKINGLLQSATIMRSTSDPGEFGAENDVGFSTHFGTALLHYRWVLQEIKGSGAAEWYSTVTPDLTSLDTRVTALEGGGISVGVNTRNLIGRGSSFGDNPIGSLGATPPVGYDVKGTPSNFTIIAAPTELGVGQALQVTADAANEGVQRTVTGLKSGKTYAFNIWVKANAGDSGEIKVDTGTGTDFTTTYNETVWTKKSGTFVVGAASNSVTWHVDADLSGDIFSITLPSFVEQESIQTAGPANPYDVDESTVAHVVGNVYEEFPKDASNPLEVSVTVPGPGYRIEVTAELQWVAAGSSVAIQQFRFREDSGSGFGDAGEAFGKQNQNVSSPLDSIARTHEVLEPTPGSVYTYRLHVRSDGNAMTCNPVVLTENHQSRLIAKVVPWSS